MKYNTFGFNDLEVDCPDELLLLSLKLVLVLVEDWDFDWVTTDGEEFFVLFFTLGLNALVDSFLGSTSSDKTTSSLFEGGFNKVSSGTDVLELGKIDDNATTVVEILL